MTFSAYFFTVSCGTSAQVVEDGEWNTAWNTDEHVESKFKSSYFKVNSLKFSFL